MKKITVSFENKSYLFTYYQTTINTDNLYFVITEDREAVKMLVEDHFFISLDYRGHKPYYVNAITTDPVEQKFKTLVAEKIVLRDLKPVSKNPLYD